MKKNTKIILASAAGLLAITGVAIAAQGYKHHSEMKRMFSPERILERFDTDGDRAISLEEINAAAGERFTLADKNTDGSVEKADVIAAIDENVTSDRFKRRSGRITDRIFASADIDQDGTLTKSELENRIGKFHAIADWNDDGKVEVSEMKRLRHSLPGRWGKRHGKKQQ